MGAGWDPAVRGDPQQPAADLLATERPNVMAGVRTESRAPSHQDGVLCLLFPVLGCMRLRLLVATEKSCIHKTNEIMQVSPWKEPSPTMAFFDRN